MGATISRPTCPMASSRPDSEPDVSATGPPPATRHFRRPPRAGFRRLGGVPPVPLRGAGGAAASLPCVRQWSGMVEAGKVNFGWDFLEVRGAMRGGADGGASPKVFASLKK